MALNAPHASTSPQPASPELDALYRKVSARIVPFLFVAFVIAFLDRINIGFAQLQMKSDLGFGDAVYGLGAGIFFLGYFLFEVPSNLVLEKIGARRTFARIMILWGIVSAATAMVKTPNMLYFMRFLLGVFEAGFFPGIVLYLTYWFPSSRRARVTSWMFVAVAVAGVLGGILSGAIMQYCAGLAGLAGWQWLFILEGLPAIAMGFLSIFWLVDSPKLATWLNDHERALLMDELARDAAAKRNVAASSLRQVLTDPKVLLLCLVYATLTGGTIAISLWLPTVVHNAGAKGVMEAGMLSAIPYGIGIIGILAISRHSDLRRERLGHYAACVIGGGIALFLLGQFGQGLFASLALLSVAVALTFAALPVFWSIPPDYLSGSAAAGGIAVISSVGQLGSFFGPTLVGWLKQSTGNLTSGLNVLALLLVLGGLALRHFLAARATTHRQIA